MLIWHMYTYAGFVNPRAVVQLCSIYSTYLSSFIFHISFSSCLLPWIHFYSTPYIPISVTCNTSLFSESMSLKFPLLKATPALLIGGSFELISSNMQKEKTVLVVCLKMLYPASSVWHQVQAFFPSIVDFQWWEMQSLAPI